MRQTRDHGFSWSLIRRSLINFLGESNSPVSDYHIAFPNLLNTRDS
ncbi:hypothetical protein FHS27_003041 [Rhodopirellula rubra]|uniref:Uncharacterized protein n=1 Tax=Aporhodopirellula rubra TaxID=980271 RepID=A0A7W5DZT8_9BACT|nr:hypothetical protein [Aporhodopirellula rubra]MBB3207222.1 hypothetical protein [Aporhodopirellula rubra]